MNSIAEFRPVKRGLTAYVPPIAFGLFDIFSIFSAKDEIFLGDTSPYDTGAAGAAFLGYANTFTKLRRKPVEEFVTIDRFDGDAFSA